MGEIVGRISWCKYEHESTAEILTLAAKEEEYQARKRAHTHKTQTHAVLEGLVVSEFFLSIQSS